MSKLLFKIYPEIIFRDNSVKDIKVNEKTITNLRYNQYQGKILNYLTSYKYLGTTVNKNLTGTESGIEQARKCLRIRILK